MANLFGLMFYHFANLAVEELGDKKGREFIAESVKWFCLERADRVRKKVEELGLEPKLENYNKVIDLPRIASEGDSRETFCPFAEVRILRDTRAAIFYLTNLVGGRS